METLGEREQVVLEQFPAGDSYWSIRTFVPANNVWSIQSLKKMQALVLFTRLYNCCIYF